MEDRPLADVSPFPVPAADRETGIMKKCAKVQAGRRSSRTTRLCGAALATGLLLSGCAENGDMMRAVGWFGRQTAAPPQKTVLALPETPDALGTEGMEGAIRNAMELAKAKRFTEARATMADLARQVPPDSDLWRSLKCSEMILALRGNDLRGLIEGADAVERNLRDPLRPPLECVSQISIARALRGQPLPLNAPESLASALQSVPRPREVRAAVAGEALPATQTVRQVQR